MTSSFPADIVNNSYIKTCSQKGIDAHPKSLIEKIDYRKMLVDWDKQDSEAVAAAKVEKDLMSRAGRSNQKGTEEVTLNKDEVEHRMWINGEWYTKNEFYEYYGGYDEWDYSEKVAKKNKLLKSRKKKIDDFKMEINDLVNHINDLNNEQKNSTVSRKLKARDKRIEELLLEKQDLIEEIKILESKLDSYNEYINQPVNKFINDDIEEVSYVLEEHDNEGVTWAWHVDTLDNAKYLASDEYNKPWSWFEIHSMDKDGYTNKLETGVFVTDGILWGKD